MAAALVDTNVLVYSVDVRDPRKQRIAAELLRAGIARQSLRIAHQALVEFVAAVMHPVPGSGALLGHRETSREIDEFLGAFDVLYPNDAILRTAVRGAAAYQLPWFDAHMWAHAEHYGLTPLYSEDFQHDRMYGTVRIVNPFL